MISDPQVAARVRDSLYSMMEELKTSLRDVKANSPAAESAAYTQATAPIAGAMLTIVEQIYERHPQLKPDGWDE